MIFVTVGTHEQGMDRLFIELDNLIEQGTITEEVFAQIGYTEYKPKRFRYKKMLEYDEMDELVRKSNIVITHGGPGSIFHPLQYGKIPIVVPRNPQFNEHVDNHQILFAKRLEEQKKIISVYEIEKLGNNLSEYTDNLKKVNGHSNMTNKFVDKFAKLINEKLFNS